jgi:long-chain acyl-CoA synthetase
VGCVIFLKDGATLSEDEIRTFVGERLASFKVPTRVAFSKVPLPRNPAGKFLKRDLREHYFV